MAKKPNLAEVFQVGEQELVPKNPDVVEIETAAEAPKPKKRHIGGYFEEDVFRQWKILGVESGKTTQQMLEEAFDMYFQFNDKPSIAKKRSGG